jgi:hypothetical protein
MNSIRIETKKPSSRETEELSADASLLLRHALRRNRKRIVAAEANVVSRRHIRGETRSRDSLTLIRLSYALTPLAEPPNRFPCASLNSIH